MTDNKQIAGEKVARRSEGASQQNIEPARKQQRKRFVRYEWFKCKKLGLKWRRPRGLHSKMRQGRKGKPPQVNIGFGKRATDRGMLNGYAPIIVQSLSDLARVDVKKQQAAVLASGLGLRKAGEIVKKAEQSGIVILNDEKAVASRARAWMIDKQREERAKAKTEAEKETKAETKTAKAQMTPEAKEKLKQEVSAAVKKEVAKAAETAAKEQKQQAKRADN